MFNYNHLYYFYITAKLGGVMNASRFLKVAQPALSSQLKTFEAAVGHSLFEKAGRRMVLTHTGRQAFVLCQRAFESTEELAEFFKDSDRNGRMRLRVGVTPQVERTFIADLLASTIRHEKKRNPPLLSLVTGSQLDLVDQLRNREIDILVTNSVPRERDMKIQFQLKIPVIAVVGPKLAKKYGFNKKIPVESIINGKEIDLIVPGERLSLRTETDIYLMRKKIRNNIGFESDVLAAIVRAACEELGVAFLPLAYVQSELDRGQLIQIGPAIAGWKNEIVIAVRAATKENSVLAGITNYLRHLELKMDRI